MNAEQTSPLTYGVMPAIPPELEQNIELVLNIAEQISQVQPGISLQECYRGVRALSSRMIQEYHACPSSTSLLRSTLKVAAALATGGIILGGIWHTFIRPPMFGPTWAICKYLNC